MSPAGMTGQLDTPLVFVNYRGEDEPWAAMFLARALAERFGPSAVFLDCVSIRAGDDFRPALLRAVARSSLLLAVIGGRWLTAERQARRMLDDDLDWVRGEIALAASTGVRVVPVLVGDTELPVVADLPADIGFLAHRQYLRLRPRESQWDLECLIASLALIEPHLVPTQRG